MQELWCKTTHVWILVCSLNNFDVFVFVFHVQFLWELNLNKDKSLKFGSFKKNNKNVQKTQEKHLWFSHKGAPFIVSHIYFLSTHSLPSFLFLLVPYMYNSNNGNQPPFPSLGIT
jgi:hypothetical protein